MRNLVEGKFIIIKLADKGSCVVVWDRQDYLAEAHKQLGNMETYEDVTFGEHGLSGVVDRNNDGFLELKRKKPITENVY